MESSLKDVLFSWRVDFPNDVLKDKDQRIEAIETLLLNLRSTGCTDEYLKSIKNRVIESMMNPTSKKAKAWKKILEKDYQKALLNIGSIPKLKSKEELKEFVYKPSLTKLDNEVIEESPNTSFEEEESSDINSESERCVKELDKSTLRLDTSVSTVVDKELSKLLGFDDE